MNKINVFLFYFFKLPLIQCSACEVYQAGSFRSSEHTATAVGWRHLQRSPGFHWAHQDFIGLYHQDRARASAPCDRDSGEHSGMRWQWCPEICWSPLRFSPHFITIVEDLIWKGKCSLEIKRTSNSPVDKIQDLDSKMQCADPTRAQ